MRVFAGPNGSGKTTIINRVKGEIPFGVYINADDIEQQLSESGVLLFDNFQLKISQEDIQNFFRESNFSPAKRKDPDLWEKIKVKNNVLHTNCTIDSYLAADIAEFIRQNLLLSGVSFTYETVLSHEGKIQFLQKARDNDYRVYLYYIATEDPEINISRVNIRVAQHGHPVPPETIKERYYKSLTNLKSAIKKTNRTYIFDNSGQAAELVAEITEGEDVSVFDTKNVPNWFVKYLIE